MSLGSSLIHSSLKTTNWNGGKDIVSWFASLVVVSAAPARVTHYGAPLGPKWKRWRRTKSPPANLNGGQLQTSPAGKLHLLTWLLQRVGTGNLGWIRTWNELAHIEWGPNVFHVICVFIQNGKRSKSSWPWTFFTTWPEETVGTKPFPLC